MEWTCRCYHFRMQKPGEGSASSLPTYLKIHLKGTLSIMTLFSWYINYVPAGMMLAGLFFTLLARRKLPGGRYQAGLPPQNTWQPASWEVPMGATGSLQARGETQSPAPQKLLFQYKFLWQICNKWTARRSMGVKCLRAVKADGEEMCGILELVWQLKIKDLKLLCTIYFNFLPCQDGTFLSLIKVSMTAGDWFCGILPAHY